MTVRIEIFYSPICPYCSEAKRILLEALEEVKGESLLEEVNVFSTEGLERAKRYGIISVPAIVIENKYKMIDVPRKENILRRIEQNLTIATHSRKEEKN